MYIALALEVCMKFRYKKSARFWQTELNTVDKCNTKSLDHGM